MASRSSRTRSCSRVLLDSSCPHGALTASYSRVWYKGFPAPNHESRDPVEIKIVETGPAPFDAVLEGCGGERCGNCEPNCETGPEAPSCGSPLPPPGTLVPESTVVRPSDLVTV